MLQTNTLPGSDGLKNLIFCRASSADNSCNREDARIMREKKAMQAFLAAIKHRLKACFTLTGCLFIIQQSILISLLIFPERKNFPHGILSI
jgi:hypothetical protein